MARMADDRRLLSHRFAHEEQLRFAELSGDANPLHVDPVAARRTLLGAPVVHGMHLVLLALQALYETTSRHFGISAMRCRFLNPVLVGDGFELRLEHLDDKSSSLAGYVESDRTFELTVGFDLPGSDNDVVVPDLQLAALEDLALGDLAGITGSLSVGIDANLAKSLFPGLVARLGLPLIAELLALTRLIGMRCPGRKSLFSQFDVSIGKAQGPEELRFQVAAVDERFRRVRIMVEGARLSGELVAFVRPPPQSQPQIGELSGLVQRDEFRDRAALVVGGSRGLGEITAKLLAAGGARVVISYHRGEEDAARVAAEIESFGGYCRHIGLDVLDSASVVRKIFASAAAPRTIYYFATPHIFARRRTFFSSDLLKKFIDCYVIGFSQLVEAACEESKVKLRVFCPSTVAVDQNLRELAEYSMAKRMAEDLCAFYNRFSRVQCIVERLPRLRTDQTATLVDMPHEDGVQVMLSIVRRVEQAF
jgi:acyl dehydratase